MAKRDDIKALLTRLRHCAKNEGVTVEELLEWPDKRLIRVPNLGPKSIAVGRRFIRPPLWFWDVT